MNYWSLPGNSSELPTILFSDFASFYYCLKWHLVLFLLTPHMLFHIELVKNLTVFLQEQEEVEFGPLDCWSNNTVTRQHALSKYLKKELFRDIHKNKKNHLMLPCPVGLHFRLNQEVLFLKKQHIDLYHLWFKSTYYQLKVDGILFVS